ncbi:hypothetical protein CR513_42943, partial [Mucuna pruriens]
MSNAISPNRETDPRGTSRLDRANPRIGGREKVEEQRRADREVTQSEEGKERSRSRRRANT